MGNYLRNFSIFIDIVIEVLVIIQRIYRQLFAYVQVVLTYFLVKREELQIKQGRFTN